MQNGKSSFLDVSYVNQLFRSMPDFHSHDHLEMFYCLSDGISCLIGDDIYTVNRYDMVLFDRGTLHRTIIPEDVVYERYVLSFSQADLLRLAPEAAPLCRLFQSHKGHCVVSLMDDPERDYFHERMLRLCGAEEEEHSELFRLALLLEILIFLSRRESVDAGPPQSVPMRQMQPVLKYLGEHFSEKILLDDLCARFFMSRSRLTQTFRAATGLTVGEYLLGLRLASARRLLADDTDVEETALRCGFGSAGHFIRCFGARYGVSPKQYALRSGNRLLP